MAAEQAAFDQVIEHEEIPQQAQPEVPQQFPDQQVAEMEPVNQGQVNPNPADIDPRWAKLMRLPFFARATLPEQRVMYMEDVERESLQREREAERQRECMERERERERAKEIREETIRQQEFELEMLRITLGLRSVRQPLQGMTLLLGNEIEAESSSVALPCGVATRRKVYDLPDPLDQGPLNSLMQDEDGEEEAEGAEEADDEGEECPSLDGASEEDRAVLPHFLTPVEMHKEQEEEESMAVAWEKARGSQDVREEAGDVRVDVTGLLLNHCDQGDSDDWAIVVPQGRRSQLMRWAHDDLVAGQLSAKKTLCGEEADGAEEADDDGEECPSLDGASEEDRAVLPHLSTPVELLKEQNEDKSLESAWEKARGPQDGREEAGDVRADVTGSLLYHRDQGDPEDYAIVMPSGQRSQLMRWAHDDLSTGHLAEKKMFARNRKYFTWPGTAADLKQYCHSCCPCERMGKGSSQDTAPLKSLPRVKRPFDLISADIFGSMPTTERDKYLVTIINYACGQYSCGCKQVAAELQQFIDFKVPCQGTHNRMPSSVGRDLNAHNWDVRDAPAPGNNYWENLFVSTAVWWMKVLSVICLLFVLLCLCTTPSMVLFFMNQGGCKEDVAEHFSQFPVQFLSTLIFCCSDSYLVGHWTRTAEHHAMGWKTLSYLVLMVLILPSLGLASAQAHFEWVSTRNEENYKFRWKFIFNPDIGCGHVAPVAAKVETIQRIAPSTSKKELKSYISVIESYRRFIPPKELRAIIAASDVFQLYVGLVPPPSPATIAPSWGSSDAPRVRGVHN